MLQQKYHAAATTGGQSHPQNHEQQHHQQQPQLSSRVTFSNVTPLPMIRHN
jgi:hypothetical protein